MDKCDIWMVGKDEREMNVIQTRGKKRNEKNESKESSPINVPCLTLVACSPDTDSLQLLLQLFLLLKDKKFNKMNEYLDSHGYGLVGKYFVKTLC